MCPSYLSLRTYKLVFNFFHPLLRSLLSPENISVESRGINPQQIQDPQCLTIPNAYLRDSWALICLSQSSPQRQLNDVPATHYKCIEKRLQVYAIQCMWYAVCPSCLLWGDDSDQSSLHVHHYLARTGIQQPPIQ